MYLHRNAKLGLAGRLQLVRAIEGGLSLRAAARAFSVSVATAHRWWRRWLEADEQERQTLARPLEQAALLPAPDLSRRRAGDRRGARADRLRLRPAVAAAAPSGLVDLEGAAPTRAIAATAGSAAALAPLRVVKRRRAPAHGRQEAPSLPRPGHRVTGDRSRHSSDVGYDYLHCLVDDHSRLAYVELHPREDAATNAATLERGLVCFAELGLPPPQAVMTDNAFVYTKSRRFRELLRSLGARHILIPPYTPRWNGKVERLIRTLQDEWAYVREWRTSSERARALSSFLRFYNRQRPHSSLEGLPPISRVHNLCGDHS